MWPWFNVWASLQQQQEQCSFRPSPETPRQSQDWELVREQKPSPASCRLQHTPSLNVLHPTLHPGLLPVFLSSSPAHQDKACQETRGPGWPGHGPQALWGAGCRNEKSTHNLPHAKFPPATSLLFLKRASEYNASDHWHHWLEADIWDLREWDRAWWLGGGGRTTGWGQ